MQKKILNNSLKLFKYNMTDTEDKHHLIDEIKDTAW